MKKKLKKNKRIKFNILILRRTKYNEIVNELKLLRDCNQELAKENSVRKKAIDDLKSQQNGLEIDNAAFKTISKMQEDEISKLKLNNQETETNNKQLKDKIHRLSSEKGGYIKENNKLRAKLDAKDRVIEEYEKAIENLENKNQIQLEKIKELSQKVEHETIEYENDGLPRQTKQVLTVKRKNRRK